MTSASAFFDAINIYSTGAALQQAWGGVSALMDAVGFAKTADTGQMVVSSLSAAAPAGYSQYEIRSYDDGLGAVFMKFEYGRSASTGNRPVFRVTLGSGSDGLGNITGVFYNQIVWGDGNAFTAGSYNQYASLSDGVFSIALQGYHSNAASPQTMWFVMERERNPDTGAKVPGGWLLYLKTGGAAHSVHVYNASIQNQYSGVASSFAQSIPYFGGGSSMIGESAYTGEIMPLLGMWPRIATQVGVMFFWAPEMQIGNIFYVSVYNQVRRYLAVAKSGTYTPIGTGGTNTNLGLAVLFE